MAFGYLSPYRRRGLTSSGGSGGGSLFDLHRQMNTLFDDLFNMGGEPGAFGRGGMLAPALDVHQDENKVEITAELPGVKEDDIELTVEDGVLTLRGEKRSARKDEQTGYSERSYGSFERRITLPPNADEDACSADFKDGVLTITLPINQAKSRGRRIALGRGQSSSGQADASGQVDSSTPGTSGASGAQGGASAAQGGSSAEPDRWATGQQGSQQG